MALTVCGSRSEATVEAELEVLHQLTGLSAHRPEKRGPTPPRRLDERGRSELYADAIKVISTSQLHFKQSSSAIHHEINNSVQAIRRRLKALGEISPRTPTQEALRALVGDEIAQDYRRYLINRRTVFKVNHNTKMMESETSSDT